MKQLANCVCAISVLVVFAAMAGVYAETGGRGDAAAPGVAVQVKINNFTFTPSVLTIREGTTVEWTNRNDMPHTVVSDDKTAFKSKVLDTDDKFSFTFTKPGSYPYFCSLHPRMTGTIVVQ